MRNQVMNVNNFFGYTLITRILWIMKMTLHAIFTVFDVVKNK